MIHYRQKMSQDFQSPAECDGKWGQGCTPELVYRLLGFPWRNTMSNEGFSLVELLIVVVIIAILVLISVPMLRESKLAAENTAAIATLRFLSNAEEVYYSTTAGSKSYGTFEQMPAKGYLDDRFA